jgi:hypothetical protein
MMMIQGDIVMIQRIALRGLRGWRTDLQREGVRRLARQLARRQITICELEKRLCFA